MESLIRATFGRLSKFALDRITVGHIQIEDTVLDRYGRRLGHTGGKAGKNKVRDPNLGVKFIPFIDEFKKQRLREDREIIDLVLIMIEGELI